MFPGHFIFDKIFIIYFVDTNSASRALEHVNGYLLKDRPIIIQYGRKNSSSNSPT